MHNNPATYHVPPQISASFMGDRAQGSPITLLMDSAPYPAVEGPADPETVAMLKQDYAGAFGELSAITLYIYQNTVSDPANPSYSNALLQIAMVEMTHLDMLADAIKTLGGNPTFDDGKYYWSASYLDYSDSMEGMLKAGMKSETAAIEGYEAQIATTKNESVQNFLRRIVNDEKLHLKFFTDQLEQLHARE